VAKKGQFYDDGKNEDAALPEERRQGDDCLPGKQD
jgi:hypothetical protein